MRYGVILPGGPAGAQVEQAVLAERAGWDAVFVWEAAYGVDAWSLLSAMAMVTSRVQLGTMLTPLPWRRPWKVASQVATLDQLSGGRAILSVGLGAIETDLPSTGEVVDRRERAGLLDEGIDLIRALWSGSTSFHGAHYDYECARDDLTEVVRPVRSRIPIWVVARWPRPRSMRRALRCDGVIPEFSGEGGPEGARSVREWLGTRGVGAEFDLIAEGETRADDPGSAAVVAEWAAAGATWWLESRWEMPHHSPERMTQIRDRIAAGPPG
ncbi:LLM class flavin-dependent oxidoreductase [Asanoa ferruginea]|uniref:LLM class flavin-dependent oxidoreductase n=1 Tax=Asanoa ferruginea TaxID=53367 RepID=UPI000E27BC83|nr:LLM class flavin-dependent oxidoreductase [Asanoa ferruginea]